MRAYHCNIVVEDVEIALEPTQEVGEINNVLGQGNKERVGSGLEVNRDSPYFRDSQVMHIDGAVDQIQEQEDNYLLVQRDHACFRDPQIENPLEPIQENEGYIVKEPVNEEGEGSELEINRNSTFFRGSQVMQGQDGVEPMQQIDDPLEGLGINRNSSFFRGTQVMEADDAVDPIQENQINMLAEEDEERAYSDPNMSRDSTYFRGSHVNGNAEQIQENESIDSDHERDQDLILFRPITDTNSLNLTRASLFDCTVVIKTSYAFSRREEGFMVALIKVFSNDSDLLEIDARNLQLLLRFSNIHTPDEISNTIKAIANKKITCRSNSNTKNDLLKFIFNNLPSFSMLTVESTDCLALGELRLTSQISPALDLAEAFNSDVLNEIRLWKERSE